jgi:glutamate dehydrogenase (NADP+)
MEIPNTYLNNIHKNIIIKNTNDREFLQAAYKVLRSLVPVVEQRPDIQRYGILERLVEPERIIMFRVSWVDDNGLVDVNRG